MKLLALDYGPARTGVAEWRPLGLPFVQGSGHIRASKSQVRVYLARLLAIG